MDQRLLGVCLSRILSGFYLFLYKNNMYKLVYPDIELKYRAEIYANEEYYQNRFNDWITEDAIVDALVSIGSWTYDGDNYLTNLEKQIEDLKVDIYKSFLNPTKLKSLKKTLTNLKNTYNRLYNTRHSLDQYTVKGYSESLKNEYILIHSLYKENNEKVFPDTNDIDFNLLNKLSEHINNDIIDISVFREIARSDQWRNYWSANKEHIFDKSTVNWTDEQKTLVVLTKMYDSAYEHPECPPDKIIEDDDMFDGWMIHQKRENEKIKNKNRTEKMLEGKNLSKAGEVFIMANSQEEAQNIYDLNDGTSRHIIKERNSMIQSSKDLIQDSNLPDVQRSLLVQANEQFKNKK